jgi:hypothetical protein
VPTLETFGQKNVRGKPPRSINHTTNVTFNKSEERIVEMRQVGRHGSDDKSTNEFSSDTDISGI